MTGPCLVCPGTVGPVLAQALGCSYSATIEQAPEAALVVLLDGPHSGPGCDRRLIRLHRSLLPAFAGPAPVLRAMMAGAAQTGLSAIRVVDRPLSGPILAQQPVRIRTRETGLALRARLDEMLVSFCASLLAEIDERGLREGTPQDPTQRSGAAPVTVGDARAVWEAMSALEVYQRVRALSGTPVCCWTTHQGERITLAQGLTCPGSGPPGVVQASGPGGIRVAAATGGVRLKRLAGADGVEIPPLFFPRRFPVGSRFGT